MPIRRMPIRRRPVRRMTIHQKLICQTMFCRTPINRTPILEMLLCFPSWLMLTPEVLNERLERVTARFFGLMTIVRFCYFCRSTFCDIGGFVCIDRTLQMSLSLT